MKKRYFSNESKGDQQSTKHRKNSDKLRTQSPSHSPHVEKSMPEHVKSTKRRSELPSVADEEPLHRLKKSIEKTVTSHEHTDSDKVYDLSKLEAGKFRSSKFVIKKSMKSKADNVRYQKGVRKEKDPYPGDAPIPEKKIAKYSRGDKTAVWTVKTRYHRALQKKKNQKYESAKKQAARSELILTEQEGYLEADDGEHTTDYTQHEIASCVDIASAQKFFELNLDKFGPYRMNYTRNGRFLLVGGAKGHVAAIDWQTKKLMCEMNVMETCSDVKWLHIETMFAVAQRQWTYIYDNQGIELHCLKGMDNVLRMEFLPYHFLLATGNTMGYLQWLDVSVGKKVAGFMTGLGRLDVMCQNPANAILHMGHSGGTVTLWSPNIKEPLVKMLCHGGGTRSVAVTNDGLYMATSGIDRTLKIWDLRTMKMLHGYRVGMGAGQMSFSQRGILAAGMGSVVEMYKDPCNQPETSAYLTHRLPGSIANLQFCPYEDVIGVGHGQGFSSLLVPGAGEPNFDALETNPYQTKKQRQHFEVKMLMEKVQPDMINIDTSALGKVDAKTLDEKIKEKQKLLYIRAPKVDFEPVYKKKGRSKSGNIEKRKQLAHAHHQKQHIRKVVREKDKMSKRNVEQNPESYSVLGRFAKKSA